MNHLPASSAEATPIGLERRSSAGELVAGELVDGKYRLIDQLGRGGMSKVWRASHEALRTEVAIKFVDEKLTLDDETRTLTLERFRFEAQISARLGVKTKHVVSVQDAGSHAGAPYLVMELVAGHTLEQEIDRDGPVDPERVASILEQSAGALASAHGLGIVHRDVKPSNIVIVDAPPGELFVKVGDFGVAKSTRASSAAFDTPTETNQGFLVGSPAFMSPEQLRSGEAVDGRTDVWGLGVVAYEALTAKLPFIGVSEADLIVLISTADPDSVTKHQPALPRALDAWFARALAKDVADRFATATEAASAFRAALDSAGPIVVPAKRSPLPLILGIAAAVIVLGIAPWLIFRSPAPPPPVEPPAPTQPVARAEPPPPPLPEPTGAAAPTATQAPTATVAKHVGHVPRPKPTAAPAPTPEPEPPAPPQRTPRKEINPSEIQ